MNLVLFASVVSASVQVQRLYDPVGMGQNYKKQANIFLR